jgi:hypothetical protein
VLSHGVGAVDHVAEVVEVARGEREDRAVRLGPGPSTLRGERPEVCELVRDGHEWKLICRGLSEAAGTHPFLHAPVVSG